jgi:hypothetical protein
MQGHQRPMGAVTGSKGLLHDGPHAFDEICAETRRAAGGLGRVRNYRPALSGCGIDPGDVLFDRDRKAQT